MNYVLQTNSLTKKYRSFQALNGLTMNVPKGSIYGFVGKNGAGKTTVIRVICGLQEPTSGNFTLYGNTSHGFRPDFFDSMMPQRAEEYVNKFIEECKKTNCFKKINTGKFGADMKVNVVNDGPVTIIMESEKK